MNWLSSPVATVKRLISTIGCMPERLDELKISQGIILAEINARKVSNNLKDFEYKVFSQWGEDGIIQHLIDVIEIENRTFIEFGVEDFSESNCRFLLMKDNWSGFVIDGTATNIAAIEQSYYFWKHDLAALHAFITKENICDLLARSGFNEDLGILSIDLDGNDYHIVEAIELFKPRILICEYNAVFGATRNISIPYDAGFVRRRKHWSNLYYGASLGAITHLAEKRGYSLVGTNGASCNAFFVRRDLLNSKIDVLSAEEAYSSSRFRESRDEAGNLTYVSGDDRLELLKGLPVLNVDTNTIELL